MNTRTRPRRTTGRSLACSVMLLAILSVLLLGCGGPKKWPVLGDVAVWGQAAGGSAGAYQPATLTIKVGKSVT
jgi:hypothetical protein